MNLQNENQMHVVSLKTGLYEGVNRADPVFLLVLLCS